MARVNFRKSLLLLIILGAGLIVVSGMALVRLTATPFLAEYRVSMDMSPKSYVTTIGATFTIDIVVSSSIPVNVFAGDLTFDENILEIVAIDYNTSIADLWAKRPWYDNGAGTVSFAGGTTAPGGFSGNGELITVTFKALKEGEGRLQLANARILIHDGLGSDATLEDPIVTAVNVSDPTTTQEVLRGQGHASTVWVASSEVPSTDLNEDGTHNVVDLSIFMRYFASGNLRADFNGDGSVSIADLSILMEDN